MSISRYFVVSVEFELRLTAYLLAGQDKGENERGEDGQEPGEAALVKRQTLYDGASPAEPCELMQDVDG